MEVDIVVPFAFGASLASIGFLLVYSQVSETLDGRWENPDPSISEAGVGQASSD